MHCAFIEKGMRLKFQTVDERLYFNRKPCCYVDDSLSAEALNSSIPFETADSIFDHISMKWYDEYLNENKRLPPQCISCISSESKGMQSHRTSYNKRSSEFANYDISRLDVMLGNRCNLACAFCTSNSSSLIESISKKLDAAPFGWNKHIVQQPNPEVLSQAIAEILLKYRVHTLKILGGEPFLKENWSKLADVVKGGFAKDTTLEITTNGTIVNAEIIESLASFKKVFLSISVDGIGRNYDFIRWPHKWNKIDENLKFLKSNTPNNTDIRIYVLINLLNVEFLPHIEKYFNNLGIHVSYSLDIKPVIHPLNFKNCPTDILENTRTKVKNDILYRSLINKNHKITSKEEIKRQLEIFCLQRKMEAKNVLGPLTYSWLYE